MSQGILHFTFIPKKSTDVRKIDEAGAIKRNDTFARQVELFEDDDVTPRVITGVCEAQLRLLPLEAGEGAAPALADITVDMTNAGTGVLVLRMTSAETTDLPDDGYWDLQNTIGGTVTTLLGGKFKVWDDVTRTP